MANNVTILDSTATTQTMKTTESAGIHTPHHIVEGAVSVTGTVALDPATLVALENITVTASVGMTVEVTNPITIGTLPSVSVSGTPSVTFGQASTTFGAITGYASILNFPASQTVTFNNPVVTGTVELGPNSLSALENISVTVGQITITGGLTDSELRASAVTISGTVTVGNSVTIGSLPAISGTVTANVLGFSESTLEYLPIPIVPNDEPVIGYQVAVKIKQTGEEAVPIGGTVTANVPDLSSCVEAFDESNPQNVIGVHVKNLNNEVFGNSGTPFPISGTVTVGNSVTIGSLPAISGTVTAVIDPQRYDSFMGEPILPMGWATADGDVVLSYNLVTQDKPLPVSGTVTANSLSDFYDPNKDIYLKNSSLYYFDVNATENRQVQNVSDGNGGPLPISGTVTANALGTRTFVDQNAVTVNGFLSVGGWDSTNSQHAPIPLTDGGTGVKIGFDDAAGAPLQVINHPNIPLSATVTIGNSVTIGSLPAISGTVTANAGSGTFNVSNRGATGISTVTTITATSSVTLMASNANRKLLTIYNEGAGNLHVLYGSGTATTANYSVKLFSGDYLEIDKYTGQVNSIFASAGTARVTEIT